MPSCAQHAPLAPAFKLVFAALASRSSRFESHHLFAQGSAIARYRRPNAVRWRHPMQSIVPVLLAGGSGTRLWPMSTRQKPKQFHKLGSSHTLFQQTVLRVCGAGTDVRFEKPIVVSNEQFADIILVQLEEINVEPEVLILEPVGRNTGPAVATAALYAEDRYPDAQLLFLPADHVITDIDAFRSTIERGASIASEGRLVTFGIEPDKPETGYGYIRRGPPAGSGYEVAAFVEKPDRPTAETYLADGSYYWNAGIYLFPVDTVLQEMQRQTASLVEGAAEALSKASRANVRLLLDASVFQEIESISIDYALMEKVQGGIVVPMKAGWSDVGSWAAFSDLGIRDADQSKLLIHESDGTFALSSGPKLAVIGVPNVVVIATSEGTLVIDRKLAQDVRFAYARFEEG
jgi:mannose-1-phosphate guanylyltransferase/mannose-6-phosphate isomerase